MSKFCIFCGEVPKNKTKEHIIPQWLIKMTHHKERKTKFGVGNKGEINFPWMQYTFPACDICNGNYSDLEGRVKGIMENIFASNELRRDNIIDLLNWFDKVRVGIWLGQSLLKGEELNPNFYINQRVGISDRILVMYRSAGSRKGIMFTGTETLAFKFSPTCFALTINELTFFNYSSAFLMSENLGFPYPGKINQHSNGTLEILDVSKGRFKITRPLLNGKMVQPSVKIYQTILKSSGSIIDSPIPDYVVQNSVYFIESHIESNPFIINDFSDLFDFVNSDSKFKLGLSGVFPVDIIMYMTALTVFAHQAYEIERSLKTFAHLADEEGKEQIEFYKYILTEVKGLIVKLGG